MATFYIGGCPPDQFPPDLFEAIDKVLDFLQILYQFSEDLGDLQPTWLAETCGASTDLTPLLALSESLQSHVCLVANTLVDTNEFFQCDNWHPIYATTMYSAICYDMNEGFAWIALTQLIIVVVSSEFVWLCACETVAVFTSLTHVVLHSLYYAASARCKTVFMMTFRVAFSKEKTEEKKGGGCFSATCLRNRRPDECSGKSAVESQQRVEGKSSSVESIAEPARQPSDGSSQEKILESQMQGGSNSSVDD